MRHCPRNWQEDATNRKGPSILVDVIAATEDGDPCIFWGHTWGRIAVISPTIIPQWDGFDGARKRDVSCQDVWKWKVPLRWDPSVTREALERRSTPRRSQWDLRAVMGPTESWGSSKVWVGWLWGLLVENHQQKTNLNMNSLKFEIHVLLFGPWINLGLGIWLQKLNRSWFRKQFCHILDNNAWCHFMFISRLLLWAKMNTLIQPLICRKRKPFATLRAHLKMHTCPDDIMQMTGWREMCWTTGWHCFHKTNRFHYRSCIDSSAAGSFLKWASCEKCITQY